MKRLALLATLCLLTVSCGGIRGRNAAPAPAATITLASWNMEHLAEANDSGCRPRTDADYAAMRAYADALAADVVAFQEVESKVAAERVFDPARYTVVIEERVGSGRKGECGGRPGLTFNAQRTGFAIRNGLAFERQPDFTELQVGNPDLRSGVDLVVRPARGRPVRVLSVHLKAGCTAGDKNEACAVLFEQVPVLERWIDARAAEGMRFAVLGDFNRRPATRSGWTGTMPRPPTRTWRAPPATSRRAAIRATATSSTTSCWIAGPRPTWRRSRKRPSPVTR
jgi:endonuclease/exonuclease/phosphatase family metal-dependent hydrolase